MPEYVYYMEGQPALSRSINAYLKKRDKLTRDIWQKELYPVMKEAKNEIITKLKSYDNLTDWQMYNLRRIQASIQETIDKMEMQMIGRLKEGQLSMSELATVNASRQAVLAGLNEGMGLVTSEKLVESLLPLSEQFLSYFAKDVSKIINADISLGLVQGQSVAKVARTITEKFGLTDSQIALYKSDKARWESYLSQGKVSQERYDKKIGYLNKQLEKGSMMSYARAERISRTEMLRASSMARQSRMEEIAELDKNAVKIWLHSGKPDGRETHMEAEAIYKANPIKTNEQFYIDGEYGMFPRDVGFSAKNTVNCACTHIIINKNEL